jgi:hypothetical protein
VFPTFDRLLPLALVMAMIRAMTTIETLVSEQLWQAIQPLLPAPAPRYGGRPRG